MPHPSGPRRPRRPRLPAGVLVVIAGALAAFLVGRWSVVPQEALRKPPAQRARPAKKMPAEIRGIPLVLDGDTIDFHGTRVRLFGIDAPERDQLCERSDGSRYGCGQLAREALVRAIGAAPVACTKRDVDIYRRMVAVCVGAAGDLGAMMVEDGSALAYRRYSPDYIDEEERARAAKRGLWQGRFDAPWKWRHEGR
jgi:endonuclease YncB( thermonuclease family)